MDEYFKISGEYIELNKLLKASGMCGTGGQAKMIIKDGLIKVDDIIETRIRRKLTHGMIVKYDTQSLKVIKK